MSAFTQSQVSSRSNYIINMHYLNECRKMSLVKLTIKPILRISHKKIPLLCSHKVKIMSYIVVVEKVIHFTIDNINTCIGIRLSFCISLVIVFTTVNYNV